MSNLPKLTGLILIEGKGHIMIRTSPYYDHDRLSYQVEAYEAQGEIGGSICLQVEELLERVKQFIFRIEEGE